MMKNIFKSLIIAALIFATPTMAFAATVKIQTWAGGGGGAETNSSNATGGGGGAFSQLNAFTVTFGTGYTVTVGTGGPGKANGFAGSGNDGTDSWFSTTATVFAQHGGGGQNGGTVGGTAGLASSGVGDTKFSGGAGGGTSGFNISDGGGGAGSGGNGTAGSGTGGGGGAGGTPDGGAGGGAGGGGGSTFGGGGGANNNFNASGSGANGQVKISATLGTMTATGGTHTSDASFDYWTFSSSGTWTPSAVVVASSAAPQDLISF